MACAMTSRLPKTSDTFLCEQKSLPALFRHSGRPPSVPFTSSSNQCRHAAGWKQGYRTNDQETFEELFRIRPVPFVTSDELNADC